MPTHPAKGWRRYRFDSQPCIEHVVPELDLVMHDVLDEEPSKLDTSCVCGPKVELIRNDGVLPDVWMATHHALDGRA